MPARCRRSTNKGRILPCLLDSYLQYKQDTRAVIAWLLSHGHAKYDAHKTISIRDLFDLAEIVKAKSVEMPTTVDFQFRHAIAARARLSRFFQRETTPGVEDPETANHEFFTASLRKIHTSLIIPFAKSTDSRNRRVPESSSLDTAKVFSNSFTTLSIDLPSNDHCSTDIQISRKCNECVEKNSSISSHAKAIPRLVDDLLANTFELRKEIQEMNDLLLISNTVWERATCNEVPIVVAAFITSVIFALFEGVGQRLRDLFDVSSPGDLRNKFIQMQENPSGLIGKIQGSSLARHVEALQHIWSLLVQFKRGHLAEQYDGMTNTVQVSATFTPQRPSDSNLGEDECLIILLRNIEQHLLVQHDPTSIVALGTPLYGDVEEFLTQCNRETSGFRCSYGLLLLHETYRTYFFTQHRACLPTSCRLQALKFAQEAIPSIQAVLDDASLPCRCPQSLAFHLENVRFEFDGFLRSRIFDLYFQSPWVSASHILEMLETLFYYGLRLFSYRHYVGSVVHVYNVLRTFTAFPLIPILENLCDNFSGILFPGGRPSRNFKACWTRHMGGRLRFNSHASDHKSGYHHMEIPAHTAKATAGLGLREETKDSRFDYRKVCLLHHIKERGYNLDDSLWEKIFALTESQENTCVKTLPRSCSCARHSHHHHQTPPGSISDQFSRLEKAVLADFTGSFPVARVNFFEVYMACVRIISIISDQMHSGKRKGQRCLCFVETIISAADRYRENEYMLQPFGCREDLEVCGEAMKTVLGDKDVEEFVWKGVS